MDTILQVEAGTCPSAASYAHADVSEDYALHYLHATVPQEAEELNKKPWAQYNVS